MKTDYQIVQKAWMIDLMKIYHGYQYDNVVVYAESRNKAKSQLLVKTKYDNLELTEDCELNYLTIPVVRSPTYDKLLFEGDELTYNEIEEKLRVRERNDKLNEILNNPLITHCYIIKRGYYYGPHSSGYTEYKTRAGVYSKERAVSEARFCNEVYPVPINVEEHDKMLLEEIQEMKLRLIN